MNIHSFPPQFIDMMRLQLGDEFDSFLAALCNGGRASRALRINLLRSNAPKMIVPFLESPVPWAQNGYYIHPYARPGATIAHFSGAFYMQEASAMTAAAVLDAQPGERVLDLCAAPGGKSTQIAASLSGEGLLVSNEPDAARAKVLASNLERLGVANAIVTNAYPAKLSAALPECFDAILVDAPCSGEGMFARDAAARSEWTPASPEGCARRQLDILTEAARMLRPGGRMVYSTCTFNTIENEEVLDKFLAAHRDFSLIPFSLPELEDAPFGTLHIYPHHVRGDGHFVARLRRAGEAPRTPAPVFSNKKEHLSLVDRLKTEVVQTLPETVSDAHLEMFGNRLYAIPADAPDLSGIKLVRPGLPLLRAGRSHIEPDHSLAMALPQNGALRCADLDEEQACAYCEGQSFAFDAPRGWTLVRHNALPLGWAKLSDDQLKNHLPKGLRRKFYTSEDTYDE